jgi:hypothetical protein
MRMKIWALTVVALAFLAPATSPARSNQGDGVKTQNSARLLDGNPIPICPVQCPQ